MKYSEVQELLKAGFTAEEIREMFLVSPSNPQNSQDNSQDDSPAAAPEIVEPAAAQEMAEPAAAPDDSKFVALNNTMNQILKAIQGNNLQNNTFDKMTGSDINTEVDKIMGSLIRPEREKGE